MSGWSYPEAEIFMENILEKFVQESAQEQEKEHGAFPR